MNICFVYQFLVFFIVIHQIYNSNSTSTLKDILPQSKCNITYIKCGCYDEPPLENSSFPVFLMQLEMPLLSSGTKWSLRGEAWDSLLQDTVCRCAQKTLEHNYNYFGVKGFDQCWSGEMTSFYRQPLSTNCIELGMQKCDLHNPSPCAGNSSSVFVYHL